MRCGQQPGRYTSLELARLTSDVLATGRSAVVSYAYGRVDRAHGSYLIWKRGPAQFLTAKVTSPTVAAACSMSIQDANTGGELTQVDSGTRREVELEGLASRNSELVNVHGRALDRSRDVVERGDGARAVGR